VVTSHLTTEKLHSRDLFLCVLSVCVVTTKSTRSTATGTTMKPKPQIKRGMTNNDRYRAAPGWTAETSPTWSSLVSTKRMSPRASARGRRMRGPGCKAARSGSLEDVTPPRRIARRTTSTSSSWRNTQSALEVGHVWACSKSVAGPCRRSR
jgi:hypothetical protein